MYKRQVLDVFVDGEVLRRDGVTITVDEEASCVEIDEAVGEYYSEI